MHLTAPGRAEARRQLVRIIATLTAEEDQAIGEAVRGPTTLELSRVLMAWEAFMEEQRSERWYRSQCLAVLIAMSHPREER